MKQQQITSANIEAWVTKRWITDNETKNPVLVQGESPSAWISAFNHNGNFTIDRVLQLPLNSIADREYIGGALTAGTFSHQIVVSWLSVVSEEETP